MFGAIAGGIASALSGGAMSKLFGGGQKAASGGIQGDVSSEERFSKNGGTDIVFRLLLEKKKVIYQYHSSPHKSTFYFNDTATTEIYTLSLHDALPIFIKEIICLQPLK